MKKLIVNADDYGHTPGVADGIRQAHLRGIVTSTSVMMNRPAAPEELVKAIRLCPQLGIGVHLVLTTGKPVLPVHKIPTLVNLEGSFYHLNEFVARIEEIDLNQVDAEWHAQVKKFITITGRAPDHLDSHHHSSYFTSALFERMLHLAEELNCPIRKPFGDDSADSTDYLPEELAVRAKEDYLRLSNQKAPRTTDCFIGDFYDEGVTIENLIRIIERIHADQVNETFELMCHPAIVDDALIAVTSYNIPRGRELEILTSNEVKTILLNHSIKLANYSELVRTALVE